MDIQETRKNKTTNVHRQNYRNVTDPLQNHRSKQVCKGKEKLFNYLYKSGEYLPMTEVRCYFSRVLNSGTTTIYDITSYVKTLSK